jgi:hypothetical protein
MGLAFHPSHWVSEIDADVDVDPEWLRRAKKAYSTRFLADCLALLPDGYEQWDVEPSAGDFILARTTGTGSGNDPWLFTHAETQHVLDFTDFGFPTTFLMDHAKVRGLLTSLIGALTTAETDVVVVEIADRIAADCQGGVRADRCAGHQYVRSVHAGDGTEAAAGEQVGG